jgi:molecular chaperone DnaK
VTQGEDTDPDFVNKIATYKFELPPDRPAQQPIKVTYSYDVNQRMHCQFEDMKSGRKLEVDFEMGDDRTLSEGGTDSASAGKQTVVVE